MKWLWIVPAALALLAGALALVGAFLPREHSATCRARFGAAPAALHALLTDVERYPEWRADITAARRLEPAGGKARFVEETSDGPRTYAIESSDPPRSLVIRVADEDLPYGGTWTFRLEPDGEGCRLSLTEDGFVGPVIFRTLARFVFGHHATIEGYLHDLGRALGGDVAVERAE